MISFVSNLKIGLTVNCRQFSGIQGFAVHFSTFMDFVAGSASLLSRCQKRHCVEDSH